MSNYTSKQCIYSTVGRGFEKQNKNRFFLSFKIKGETNSVKMKEEELNDLKYRQLQKLAKDHGIKANLPKAALVKAIFEATNKNVSPKKIQKNEKDDQEMPEEENNVAAEAIEQVLNDTMDKKKSLSRRNSRISQMFDKDAFDLLALEASKFVQAMGVNSPRKRSSILNLTPLKKGLFGSAVQDSPLTLTPKPSTSKAAGTPKSVAKVEKVEKTPLHKRSSMLNKVQNSISRTITKPKKTVTLRASLVGTPGSVAKAKTTTGIPIRSRKVPDFAKLHAKQFGKMDTLGQYLTKKKDRIAGLTPGPKAKKPSEEVKKTTAAAAFTPGFKAKQPTEMVKKGAEIGTRKSPRNLPQPPVTEISKANFNFSKVDTKKNFTFKANTPVKILQNLTNQSGGTPGSGKKFNLKASLSKPLGYKPHTGKLRPWDPKNKVAERQKMAEKSSGKADQSAKSHQNSIIKGVRMNKRMELLLQKRKMNNK
jgi:hypothetical protein